MKKKILTILLALLLTITPVFADEIKENDANFFTDENIIVEKELGGSVFAAGLNVKVKENIDGAVFAAGNVVSVKGTSDYVFAAGQNVELEEANAKEAFLAGQNISINDSALRDVFIAGASISLNKTTVRNARIAGDTINIKGEITGDLNIAAGKVVIDDETVITGKLIINEDANLEMSKNVSVGSIEKYESKEVDIKVNPAAFILGILIKNVISYLSILTIALIMVALFKKFFEGIKKMQKESNSALKSMGIGLLTLCAVPVLCILLLITIIGIPLSAVLFMCYMLAIFISAIPSTYYVGSIIFKDKIKNEYLLVTVSLLVYYLVKWIPIAGTLLEFASLLLGLGIIIYLVKGTTMKSK